MTLTLRILATLPLTAMLMAGPQQDWEKQLEAAIQKEVIEGDLKGALQQFKAVASASGPSPAIVARALLHGARCEEKLGDREAARQAYARRASLTKTRNFGVVSATFPLKDAAGKR